MVLGDSTVPSDVLSDCDSDTNITMQWEEDWWSTSVVNQHLVCDPSIQQPGFDLPCQSLTLLNRYGQIRAHIILTWTSGALQSI